MAESGVSIEDIEKGGSREKLGDYLENTIKAKVLTEMGEIIRTGIEQIRTTCNAEWAGISKDNFLSNLDNDAAKLEEHFNALYNGLVDELSAVLGSMQKNDSVMIELD